MNPFSSKCPYAILFLSLALNIFAIGFFIGYPSSKTELSLHPLHMSNETFGTFNGLSPENKKHIASLIRQQQQEIIENKKQLQDIRMSIVNVLQQDPLDQKKLADLFERMLQLSNKNTALAQQTLFQTFILLPIKDRIKVAKVLANLPKQVASPTRYEKSL